MIRFTGSTYQVTSYLLRKKEHTIFSNPSLSVAEFKKYIGEDLLGWRFLQGRQRLVLRRRMRILLWENSVAWGMFVLADPSLMVFVKKMFPNYKAA